MRKGKNFPTQKPVKKSFYNTIKLQIKSLYKTRSKYFLEMNKTEDRKRVIIWNSAASSDKKILAVRNQKCGSTTIENIVREYSKILHKNNIHYGENIIKYDFQNKNPRDFVILKHLIESEEVIKITTVRNPIDRAISCFFHMFIDQKNAHTKFHIPYIKSMGFDISKSIEYNFDVFLEYVSMNIKEDRFFCDPHFKEQHINIGIEFIKYDKIIRLENINSEIKETFYNNKLGEYYERLKSVNTVFNKSSRSRQNIHLNQYAIAKIQDIYRKDFELFGY